MSLSLGAWLALNISLTLAGGVVALRLSAYRHWVTAFSSGALIAIAVVELLPEAFSLEHAADGLSGDHLGVLQACGVGFLLFYLLDLAVPEQHAAGHEHHRHAPSVPRIVGIVGALTLCMHRVIDGLMLSAATQAAMESIGAAVVLHNFTDGLTTVSVLLRDAHSRVRAFIFVAVVAASPLVGAALGSIVTVSAAGMGLSLAGIAGALLYVGGSHLFERHHHGSAQRFTPVAALVGFFLVYWLRH